MSPAVAPPFSDLDAFLDRLAAEGYAVGVRERLAAHALFEWLAERDELPDHPDARLRLLEPLLSRSADEQRHFEDVVDEFLPRSAGQRRERRFGAQGIGLGARGGTTSTSVTPRRRTLAALVLLGTAWLVWQSCPTLDPVTASPPTGVANQGMSPDTPVERSSSNPIYVPVGTFTQVEMAVASPDGRLPALRWALGALGAVLALGWGAWLVRRLRQVIYLQGVRSDSELEDHVLRDPDPVALTIPQSRVRGASRMLRQRVAGSREELDLGATLRATVRAGGALAPRFRALHHTPEYLVLIDWRSVHDHQAASHELLVGALQQCGVAVDLFHFEGSPGQGCCQRSAGRNAVPPGAHPKATFAQLSNRYGGHRLLVFGDATAAFDPIGGHPADWVRHATQFPNRAWFSPLPLASWGAAEAGLDRLGFLVLPTQPEALETLAEWLSSERATLSPGEDWPGVFPPSLRGSGAAWVARQAAPPSEAEEDLLVELRLYLGEVRFQWLCACSVFPSLSWPLTLALGREVLSHAGAPADSGALARGVAALGALPWFRHGRMPGWLREALLDRVDPGQERYLRALVERRLAAALEGGTGARLADVAVRRRLAAWFSRGTGIARDVVLAGFLERGMPRRLAQRMPEPLRRLLFKNGKPLYGLRRGVLAAWGMTAAFSLTAVVPSVWGSWTSRLTSPTTERVPDFAPDFTLQAGTGAIRITRFSPDGQRIFSASAGGVARLADIMGRGSTLDTINVIGAAFSPDGRQIAAASVNGTMWLWRADDLRRRDLLMNGQVTHIAFNSDGELVSVSRDGTIRIWRSDLMGRSYTQQRQIDISRANLAALSSNGERIVVVSGNALRVWSPLSGRLLAQSAAKSASVVAVALSPDGQRIVTGDEAGSVEVPAVGRLNVSSILSGHRGRIRDVDFSPNGRQIVTASDDGTARVWRTDAFGPPVVLPHGSAVLSARFSPDGQRIVTGDAASRLRVWGRRPLFVNIASCSASPVSDPVARPIADRLAQTANDDTIRFNPVAYSPVAWDTARLGLQPRRWEVWYSEGQAVDRLRAIRLVSRLRSITNNSVPWNALPRATPPGVLSVGLCNSYATSRSARSEQATLPNPVAAPPQTSAGSAAAPSGSTLAPPSADTNATRQQAILDDPVDTAARAQQQAVPENPTPLPPPDLTGDDVGRLRARNLLIPVEGITANQLRDTYNDARSGGRLHDAIDIYAPRGTPVLATTDGVILKLYRGARGGTTIYQLDNDGRTRYYYAHLDRYAAGLTEGMRVRRGQVIGYVGNTGNSAQGEYQLHFSVAILDDVSRWWGGRNINPYDIWR